MKIKKNSVIDVIALSSKPSRGYLNQISGYIESLGFSARIADDIESSDEIFYANTTPYRANAFKKALLAPDSNIIWALKGGRGSTELIDYLDDNVNGFDPLPKNISNDKILVGFSDVTTLHTYVIANYSMVTLHADMLERILSGAVDKSSVKKLEDILCGTSTKPLLYELTKISEVEIEPITGKIIGGNLTLITKIVGTKYDKSYKRGYFLLLEDVEESPTNFERNLTHLLNAHIFNEVDVVIFGDFLAEKSEDQPYMDYVQNRFVEKIRTLKYITKKTSVFVLKGVGHTSINNPIFLNTESIIFKRGEKYFIKIDNPIQIE